MFCDQCGNTLLAGQQYCSRCGKEVISRMGYLPKSRVQEHVRLLAILWIAYSAMNVFGGVALILIANSMFNTMLSTIFSRLSHGAALPPEVTLWLRPLFISIGSFVLIKAAAGFFAGWGLLQRESWARILALVVGFIALFNIPVGTVLGIYTLWVLLPARADQEYRALSHSQAA